MTWKITDFNWIECERNGVLHSQAFHNQRYCSWMLTNLNLEPVGFLQGFPALLPRDFARFGDLHHQGDRVAFLRLHVLQGRRDLALRLCKHTQKTSCIIVQHRFSSVCVSDVTLPV